LRIEAEGAHGAGVVGDGELGRSDHG
jgi:hypothetical protein